MKRSPLPRRRPAGFSLTESMAALAVSLVALGSAVPGFETARERRQLEGVAAQLETDLQLARSEAVALNRTVRIAFDADAAGACYIVHTGGAQQCRCGASGPECAADVAVLRLRTGEFGFVDVGGGRLRGDRKLECELTLRDGRVVWDLNGITRPDWDKSE